MLHTLHVRNLALIESAELHLAAGLNVFSGETGGGKSLLITALKLLRGDRARAGLVRRGARELQVDGEFRLGGAGSRVDAERSAEVRRLVDEMCGGSIEDDLLLVTRIIDRQGRSRVRIGGRPATLQALRTLGNLLVEIHGQGDSREWTRPETHCQVLDGFADCGELREQFAEAWDAARQLRERLRTQEEGQQEQRQRLEFLRFQQREMAELALADGELVELEAEHQRLANVDAVREGLHAGLAALQEGEHNASELLSLAAAQVRSAAALDSRLQAVAGQFADAEALVDELCRGVQSGMAGLDFEPGRLTHVETRLDEIQRLLRRFGPTEREFRERLVAVTEELDRWEGEIEEPEEMAAQLQERTAKAAALGRKLLRARRRAAKEFTGRVGAGLQDLGMPHTELRIAMPADFRDEDLLDQATRHGPVAVDIEVRINPGEPFRPLGEVASGGELARVVLAVKKAMAQHDRVPLLVLDEIDAEIGSRLGLQVGGKLAAVAEHHQVVIVTHLPQVAAFADRHFLVAKAVVGKAEAERTTSTVRALDRREVEHELAAMAGDAADAANREQARSLVRKVRPGVSAGQRLKTRVAG